MSPGDLSLCSWVSVVSPFCRCVMCSVTMPVPGWSPWLYQSCSWRIRESCQSLIHRKIINIYMKPYIGFINEGESRKSQGAKWENLTTLRDRKVFIAKLWRPYRHFLLLGSVCVCVCVRLGKMLEVKNKSCFKFLAERLALSSCLWRSTNKRWWGLLWCCSEQLAQHTCSVLCV